MFVVVWLKETWKGIGSLCVELCERFPENNVVSSVQSSGKERFCVLVSLLRGFFCFDFAIRRLELQCWIWQLA
jgi:hypothetical protein